ncbi:MAG TPA: hypothetical protein VFM18_11195 [Methanosarcina sp.]|nr:hypothetical protein [Methanosarcina sp.]
MKLPSSRKRLAAIAIEINPVDAAGSATKKRGIVLRSASQLDESNRILANQKLVELLFHKHNIRYDMIIKTLPYN